MFNSTFSSFLFFFLLFAFYKFVIFLKNLVYAQLSFCSYNMSTFYEYTEDGVETRLSFMSWRSGYKKKFGMEHIAIFMYIMFDLSVYINVALTNYSGKKKATPTFCRWILTFIHYFRLVIKYVVVGKLNCVLCVFLL